jgi:O-methyltransferase
MLKGLFKAATSLISKRHYYLIRSLNFLGRETLIPLNNLDYVRVTTLELLANEIVTKNVIGEIAELGVYKGGFAKYINAVFTDRDLYLFDTFEGFSEEDIEYEKKIRNNYKHQDFANTSINEVLKIMPYPKKCIIKKGHFPQSFEGLENKLFAFVSIDVDLFEPTLKGLETFYPRISSNGFIMVHDYSNRNYPGCKKAIEQFCLGKGISYVPIPDIGGSVVIRKI